MRLIKDLTSCKPNEIPSDAGVFKPNSPHLHIRLIVLLGTHKKENCKLVELGSVHTP